MEYIAKEFNLGVGFYDDDGNYIIDLTEKGFGDAYSLLEKADLEHKDELLVMNAEIVSIVYIYNDQFEINLKGDLENNTYQVIIKEQENG